MYNRQSLPTFLTAGSKVFIENVQNNLGFILAIELVQSGGEKIKSSTYLAVLCSLKGIQSERI